MTLNLIASIVVLASILSPIFLAWYHSDEAPEPDYENETAKDGLKRIYKEKLLPFEKFWSFHDFHSPALCDADFDSNAMILLVGQFSTGKTTLVRHLLGESYPDMQLGPEPAMDRFHVISYGNQVIPGHVLANQNSKHPFQQLKEFGPFFLNILQGSLMPNAFLRDTTLIDTPGILSGKQQIEHGYDFCGVINWFAHKVESIILMFDIHKLDLSEEMKDCIGSFKGNEEKIHIVLNKADMVGYQELQRAYGALMWSMARVFHGRQVPRVYIITLSDKPLAFESTKQLLKDEKRDLYEHINGLHKKVDFLRLNNLVRRAELAKAHSYVLAQLKLEMPWWFGREYRKQELISKLDKIYEFLMVKYDIHPGYFPDLEKMRQKLQVFDFTKFKYLDRSLMNSLDTMLSHDVAKLSEKIQKAYATEKPAGKSSSKT